MKHEWTTALLSFLLLVLPFLGLPASVDYTIVCIIGLFFFWRSILALKHHYGAEADKAAALSVTPTPPTVTEETSETEVPQRTTKI